MRTIIRKLVPFLLAFTVMLSACSFAQAESAGAYVLMNIPFAEFYAAEVTDASTIDAVSSSTLMKPRTGGLAGGSYHVDAAGSDISGVIFPVYVEDASVLATLGGTEITDDAKVEITVTNKGEEKTTAYEGKEALFEAPDYSWYALSETPAQFKTLTVVDRKPAFSTVNTDAEKVNVSARLFFDKHVDQAIKLDGMEEVLGDQQASAIILIADDGTRVGLRHIANIWRGLQVGFKFDSAEYASLAGKTIVSIEYLTKDNHYIFDTNVQVASDQRLAAISDTYIELFPEFAKEEYKDWWMECIKAYPVNDETAEMYYTMLTQQFLGSKYGQEAIDAFSSNPAEMAFDCFFENGITKIIINGNEISGIDTEGKQIFCHTYNYVEDTAVSYMGQEMPTALHIYKTDDADAGMFTYFAFSDDLPGETQHIEFRYGDTLDNIGNYSEGVYAYWLAAGIQDGYGEKLIKACIKLFVDENVGEQFAEQTSEEAAQQTEVIEIATAEDLLAINQNLSGHYILTADIDLSSYESWPMIGTYIMDPNSPEGEDPVPEMAFTGVFDGNGHTISNVTIDASADMEKMFGIGFFACVGRGSVVKNVVFQDINVKGMMLVGGAIGYAFECTVDNVDLKATGRNKVESTMVMSGGIIGGLTCSKCVNCDVENTDVIAAPGGNSGILGGGFSKPVLENCTVKNSTLSGTMEGVPMFGMDGGNWLGGLTGCINLDDFDVNEWYVKNCRISDVEITISGKGAYVGGLTGSAGVELKNPDDPRMLISGCALENVTITVTDSIPCVGGVVGGSFSEGGPLHSFLIDNCTLSNVSIITDTEDLEESKTGMLIGQARNCQLAGENGTPLDITDRNISTESINSNVDVCILKKDRVAFEDVAFVGQVVPADEAFLSEDASEAAALLENIKGTYEPLFPVITKPEYDQLWLDPCIAVVGEEAAPQAAEMLKSACNGTIYGQEAMDAFGDGSNGAQFDCLFINGVSTLTFNGTTISGADESGNQVFSHEYTYTGKLVLGGMMEGYLYETADEDAGEFKYFYMMPDTPATTFHLEFRYGSNVDDLAKYNEGPYAYWLAAALQVDADEEMIKNVITLFCEENLAEAQAEDAA